METRQGLGLGDREGLEYPPRIRNPSRMTKFPSGKKVVQNCPFPTTMNPQFNELQL